MPAPTPCYAPRSSTTGSTRWGRSRRISPRPALRCGRPSYEVGSRNRGVKSHARNGEPAVCIEGPGEAAALGGLFHVSGGGACIAIRGRRNAGLVTARTAARRRPLGPTATDSGGSGVLELLAHAIELRRVRRAEPAARHGRFLAVTSTTTTHRRARIARTSRTHVPCELLCTPCAGISRAPRRTAYGFC